MWCLVALVVLAVVGVAPAARAQPASGLYESWSAVRMQPVGPLAGPPTALPRWLDVETRGDLSAITFRPAGRVVWRVRWGPWGPVEKRTEVDGQLWTRSVFEYDPGGCLRRKTVTGPGTEDATTRAPWVYTYQCDARGRVVEREGTLLRRVPWGERALRRPGSLERWRVTWGARRVEARLVVDGREVRRDTFDAAGRTLRVDLVGMALVYRRDAAGRLLAIHRIRGRGRSRPAAATARDPTVRPDDLQRLGQSVLERHEAELLLGAPVTTTEEGRGVARRTDASYAPNHCWLDRVSTLEYDASDVLVGAMVTCICGFCVDAALPVTTRGEVRAVDLHWTLGPWVRLDGEVAVTADHALVTPAGPRAAGTLRAGDVVLGGDGRPRVLRAVERLPARRERLGRNVRTADGTFVAGGFVFVSEAPAPCPPRRPPLPQPAPRSSGGAAR